MSRGTRDLVRNSQNSNQPKNGRGNGDGVVKRTSSSSALEQDLDVRSGTSTPPVQPQPPVQPRAAEPFAPSNPKPGPNQHVEVELVSQLKAKVDKQRAELDNRTDNVNAIQRNFQRLSEMYSADRERAQQTEQQLQEALAEIETLKKNKNALAAVSSEFQKLRENYQSLETELEESDRRHQKEIADYKKKLAASQQEQQMLQQTLAKAGNENQREQSIRDRISGEVDEIEKSTRNVLLAMLEVHKAVELLPPICGEGISLDEGHVERKRANNNGGGEDGQSLESRLVGVSQQLTVLSLRGIPPVLEGADRMKRNHKKELHDLQCDMDETKGALDSQIHSLTDRLNKADERNELLSNKLKEAQKLFDQEKKRLLDDLSSGQSTLSTELDRKEGALRSLSLRLEESEAKLKSLQLERDAAVSDKDQLAGDLDRAKKLREQQAATTAEELAALTSKLAQSEKLAIEVASNFQESEAKCKSFANELDELRSKLEKETTQFDRERKAWAAERSSLQQLAQSGATTSSQELATLRGELAAAKDELQTHLVACTKAGEEKDGALSAAKKRHHEYEREIEQLQHSVALSNAEKTKMSLHNDELKTRVSQLTEEVELLRGAAANADAFADAEAAKVAMEEEIATLKSQFALREKELSNKVKHLEGTVRTLTDEVRQAHENESRANALHASATADLSRVSRECDAQKTTITQLNAQIADLTDRIDIARRRAQQSDASAEEAKRFAAEMRRMQDELANAKRTLEDRTTGISQWASEVKALHQESVRAVKRILSAEEACESGYSCQGCFEIMKDPTICAPCGHAFCRGCFDLANKGKKKQSYCPSCGDDSVTTTVPSENLELLSGKFTFRCRALKDLAAQLERSLAKELTMT